MRCLIILCLLSGWWTTVRAASPQTMPLYRDKVPHAKGDDPGNVPQVILYRAPRSTAADAKQPLATPAVVVLPGGGYGGLAIDHEGHQIAKWLNDLGITALICQYRHRGSGTGYGHPVPMHDAQYAIQTVRARADQWNVDPQRIGVIGFSAGGHLASTVSTHFRAADPAHVDPIERVSSRPDFAILCYPVIGFDKPYTHRGSQRNLLGENPDPQTVQSLSNETQVSAETPPTFLWATSADKVVPADNSVHYYLALLEHQVPTELHVYERGRHGLGLAAGHAGAEAWPEQCVTWLRARGFLPKDNLEN